MVLSDVANGSIELRTPKTKRLKAKAAKPQEVYSGGLNCTAPLGIRTSASFEVFFCICFPSSDLHRKVQTPFQQILRGSFVSLR